MRYLVLFALIAAVAAKPMPGYLSGLDLGGHGLDSDHSYIEQAPVIQAAQVLHSAPIIHAPIAVAKAQATSYSSFKRVIHPVSHNIVQAAPILHAAPIVHAAPVVHATKVIQSAPILSLESHEPISYGHGSFGHGW